MTFNDMHDFFSYLCIVATGAKLASNCNTKAESIQIVNHKRAIKNQGYETANEFGIARTGLFLSC